MFDIGIVTTIGYYCTFSKSWTPQKEDTYTVTASFVGDDSYGISGAATAVSVGPAPAEIVFPEAPTTPDYTMTIIGMGITIIIALAIAVLILFRRH